jgi:CDP-diacylglycerol--glycerol-3-phosphate 3-phosphatidyltransferase/cardiolipin synthase
MDLITRMTKTDPLARRLQGRYTSPNLNLPDWLSLVRVPLGVAFVPLAGRPIAALAVLALAAVSDMLDGWLARRQPPGLTWVGWGEWLDPICDKFFIIAVMVGLYLSQHPSLKTLLPILTREAAILVLFLIYRLVPSLRSIRYDYRANALGKATTAAQFLVAAALLFAHPAAKYLAALCALLGLLCAGVYAWRGHAMAHRRRVEGGG